MIHLNLILILYLSLYVFKLLSAISLSGKDFKQLRLNTNPECWAGIEKWRQNN